MSSSPEPFSASSPTGSLTRRSSQYTYRQLQLLRQASTSTPLRVVAHIDLDAFYAQCEMVRLETPRTTPLAVQQWDSLIAINYPAREFGITRMISAIEAKKLCPGIVLQHVATFREGEGGKWAYRDDASKRYGTDKVSLDPYRRESRKILKVIREELSRWREDLVGGSGDTPELQIPDAPLEKASVDEVFIDLSPLIFGSLLRKYPELRQGAGGDGNAAMLPPPPTTALEWDAEENLVDLDKNESEMDNPDWDDVVMLIGSDIVRSLRTAVWGKLSYTCSAGIARNKMMAKLGSACNKPNMQTVVRNRAVQKFLGGFKFTKIRMLGGKLGDQVVSIFGTDQVSELLKVPLERFRANFDDETAVWLYGIIRGDDKSEVSLRTQIKSMLSAKSFRPSISSINQADKWLRIFAADIYGRLVEDGMLENRRRPRTIALHHRQGSQLRSRQASIPASKPIDELMLFEHAKLLLRQVVGDAGVWPCSNLSLSVGGFEEGVANNKAIDGFLIRGEQARSLSHQMKEMDTSAEQSSVPMKRKLEDRGIHRFFTKDTGTLGKTTLGETRHAVEQSCNSDPVPPTERPNDKDIYYGSLEGFTSDDINIGLFLCDRCGDSFLELQRVEHDDWHFAMDLEKQQREATESSPQTPRWSDGLGKSHGRSSNSGKTSRNGRGRSEKGQMRLTFG